MYPHIKFIVTGDFNQLQPVNDRVGIIDYQNSDVLFELCDGNKLELTKCRRSDDILFNISKDVENIDKKQFGDKFTYTNICFFNRTRHRVNKTCMDMFIKDKKKLTRDKRGCIVLDCGEHEEAEYNILLCNEMPVISKTNKSSLDLYNNETFKVMKCWKKGLIELKNDLTNEISKVKTEDFNKYYEIGFCVTNYKAQGMTINSDYTIYDYDHMSKEGQYVAITRATKKENINFR